MLAVRFDTKIYVNDRRMMMQSMESAKRSKQSENPINSAQASQFEW